MRRAIFFSVLCAGFLPCQAVSADTLRESVLYALESHPSIEGAKAQHQVAEYSKHSERSQYYPEISATITAGRIFQDNATSRGLSVTRGSAYSGYGETNISLRQMIFDGMETSHRVSAAEARYKSEGYILQDTQGVIISRVARNYIELIRLREGLGLLNVQEKKIQKYLGRFDILVNEGAVDEAELQQARDVLMIVQGLVADYEGRLSSAHASYHEVVGKVPDVTLEWPQKIQGNINDNVDDVLSAVKQKHPGLMSARMDTNAAQHDLKAEHGKMYPDISGELSFLQSNKDEVIGGKNEDRRAVVKMSWGFSTGGRELSEFKKKQSEYDIAAHRLEEVERQIENDVRQVYAEYGRFQRKVKLSEDRVDLNKKLVDTYRSQFEGARISLLNLMRAENQLFRAELEHNDNKFYLLSSQYDVLASLGELKNVILSE